MPAVGGGNAQHALELPCVRRVQGLRCDDVLWASLVDLFSRLHSLAYGCERPGWPKGQTENVACAASARFTVTMVDKEDHDTSREADDPDGMLGSLNCNAPSRQAFILTLCAKARNNID